MPWVYIGTSPLKAAYVGTTPVKEIYVGTTKVRPKINTPWIYYNSTLGLISLSSDWSNWITIADKNLWATQLYNYNDTINANNYWWFFQWGNNYMFPYTWPTSKTTTQVNASSYWPGNYYSNSSFYYNKNSNGWDSSYNQNKRWYTTWTNEAMQWPCATWFHVPTADEWDNLLMAYGGVKWISVTATWNGYKLASWWTTMMTELHLPPCDRFIVANSGNITTWSSGRYWANTSYYNSGSTGRNHAETFAITTSEASSAHWNSISYWYIIRPFYNEWVQPSADWTKVS